MFQQNQSKLIYGLTGTLVFIYVLYRAIAMGITYDEAWTLRDFVPLSLSNIFSYQPCDANNQILNTLLIKLFYVSGNHSLLMARLPNVLALAVYGYFCFSISDKFLNRFFGLCLFMVLMFNPFVLDFFSLARGYGLALAFQMASIFYLLKFNKSGEWMGFALSIVFAMLAVLSNFTFLYFFAAIIFTGNYIGIIQHKLNRNYIKIFLPSALLTLLLAAMIYTPLIKLISNQSLYYGGITGFYHDTLISLFSFSLYRPYDVRLAEVGLPLFLIMLTLMAVFYLVDTVKIKPTLWSDNGIIIMLLMGVSMMASLVNHYISASLYLTDRTALLFFPLLIMALIFFANGIKSNRFKIPSVVSVMLLCGFSLVNFSLNANEIKTISWPFDAHTEEILNKINAKGIEEKKTLMLDFSWPFESSIEYYVTKNKYSNIQVAKNIADRDQLNTQADYYIYYDKPLDKVGYHSDEQIIRNLKKDTAFSFQNEDIYVFKGFKSKEGGNE